MTLLFSFNIPENIREKFNTGYCDSFAVALHKLTKLQLGSIVRKTLLPEEKWYGDDENDKYDFEHAHAFVLLAKDIYADINGIHKFSAEKDNCYWLAGKDASLPYIECFGDDVTALDAFYGELDNNMVQEAKKLVEKYKIIELIKTSRYFIDNQNI